MPPPPTSRLLFHLLHSLVVLLFVVQPWWHPVIDLGPGPLTFPVTGDGLRGACSCQPRGMGRWAVAARLACGGAHFFFFLMVGSRRRHPVVSCALCSVNE